MFEIVERQEMAQGTIISNWVKAPKIAQKAYDSDRHKVILVIDKNGRIYLKGKKIDLNKLESELKNTIAKDGVIHLLLEADKEVRHGRIVQIMDLAKKAGVSSIIIAARWDPKGEN